MEQLESSFPEICHHTNTKHVQVNQLETDKININARVLQMNFAIAYVCEDQNEIQSALWSMGNIKLFTAASVNNGHKKPFLICTNCKRKDKELSLFL